MVIDKKDVLHHTGNMPAKNSLKIYAEDSYYHLYNRGVEKRLIFLDKQDYGVFLSYLKEYLLQKNKEELHTKLNDPHTLYGEKEHILRKLKLNNFFGEITLIAYCLMPNHFHLLVKQKSAGSIDKLMNSLATRYTMYFNKRHRRVGSLCQDVYKAVLVESDPQLLYLTSYIHRNSIPDESKVLPKDWFSQPSSYPEYLGKRKTEWVETKEVLAFFSKTNPKLSYQAFVEQTDDPSPITTITIDY